MSGLAQPQTGPVGAGCVSAWLSFFNVLSPPVVIHSCCLAGDMNWEDQRDGSPPLPGSWCDAWRALQPGKPGLTYDAKNNPMLPYKGLALRLDRCGLGLWGVSVM